MSNPINESGYDSFLADSTNGIGANLRVKLVNGRRIAPASASEREVAITKAAVSDNRTPVACRLSNAPGTVEVQVAGAVTQGATLNRDAAGKVAVAGGGTAFGIADGAATDDVIPVFPL